MEIKTKHMAARILDDYRLGMKDQDALYESLEMGVGALIREHERENPEPLTLEQLREMDGEPVWVEHAAYTRKKSGYGIVRAQQLGLDVYLPLYPSCPEEQHGTSWLAYARKPGGEVRL